MIIRREGFILEIRLGTLWKFLEMGVEPANPYPRSNTNLAGIEHSLQFFFGQSQRLCSFTDLIHDGFECAR